MKYIKSKILFSMLAIMIITLGSMIFIFYWYIKSSNNSMLSSSLEALSEQAAENFDYMINESVSDFKNAATSSDYAKLITHDNRIEYLEELFADNTAVSSIAIYNASGQINVYFARSKTDHVIAFRVPLGSTIDQQMEKLQRSSSVATRSALPIRRYAPLGSPSFLK